MITGLPAVDESWPMVRELGFAAIVKSGAATVTVIVALWLRVPLVPLARTVYVPTVEDVNESVEVLECPLVIVTLAGVSVSVGPVGLLVADRATVPLKLLRLETVMVELTLTFVGVFRMAGLAVRE